MKLKNVLILLTLIFSVGNLNVCSEEKTYIENLLADTANYLYEISFSEKFEDNSFIGLPGKHPDVRKVDVVFSEKTFSDIAKHPNRYEIEALAVKNIINGKSKDMFEPDATMTRAEFAAIIVKGL